MVAISSFLISPSSFAPYSYLCNHTVNLHERYSVLAKNLGIQDNTETCNFGQINIHICEPRLCKNSLDIKDIISRKGIKSLDLKGQKINYKTFGTFLESNETLKSTNVSLVVVNGCLELLDEITALAEKNNDIYFIKVEDKLGQTPAKSKRQAECGKHRNIKFTSIENVNNDIGDLLERIVLKTIKQKCDNVNAWLNEKKHSDGKTRVEGRTRKRKSFMEACTKIKMMYNPEWTGSDKENDDPNQDPQVFTRIQDKMSMNHKDMNGKSKVCPQTGMEDHVREKVPGSPSVSWTFSDRLQCVDRDTIESLLAEMVALYSNSNVPIYDRPRITQYEEREISEKLRKQLFDLSPSVKGVGYRFTCFVVYVERIKTSRESECLQQKILSVLKENQIDDFQIKSVSKQRYYVRVGSTIRATKRHQSHKKPCEATLGCFANIKDGKDPKTCALISNHVAKFCDSFRISSSSTTDILCTRIESSVTETGLDIAAVKLVLKDQDKKICAKFRTEIIEDESALDSAIGDIDNELLQGKLHHYSDHLNRQSNILCNGLKVYIWGGVSKPGKGVITMRSFKKGDMKALIQVEDRVPSKEGVIPERFCYPGDSGAIVCAEDSRGNFIHILAMVIGITNEEEIQRNPQIRGKYLAVPLSSGLEELKDRTGFTFQICECIDS
ncbi:uncharacterized protein LOC128551462 [Mercenaria mercenaria]|uniref:uncharacterized protein LOC128551462 n=1 Tax=Mercenaria mercenaria TaxID=6596 RepID=UPI00234E62F1|nr:uncharacterized protein LOC128551462 [Mercenaria mercenaria]